MHANMPGGRGVLVAVAAAAVNILLSVGAYGYTNKIRNSVNIECNTHVNIPLAIGFYC